MPGFCAGERVSRNYRVVRGVLDDSWMVQNFIGCDRDQSFLLPFDVRDWLPEGHLAWFVLDAVAGMDLSGFYGAYRADGVGRRAYDPAMLVALLLYGYSRGVRSARKLERACEEDVAFKTIAMLEMPDHATIARFVERHEAALAELFDAQAVVDESQIVLAAEITNNPADFSQLNPMISAVIGELERAGVTDRPQVALADAGYWNERHFDEVIANKHIQVVVPPDRGGRSEPRPGWTGGRYSWMRTVLASEYGNGLYRKRIQMIEPVFAHTKHNRLISRFHRRGRAAVRTEWRLLMATHNLTKLHRHQLAITGA